MLQIGSVRFVRISSEALQLCERIAIFCTRFIGGGGGAAFFGIYRIKYIFFGEYSSVLQGSKSVKVRT